jgi:hypothetical protein
MISAAGCGGARVPARFGYVQTPKCPYLCHGGAAMVLEIAFQSSADRPETPWGQGWGKPFRGWSFFRHAILIAAQPDGKEEVGEMNASKQLMAAHDGA